MYSGRYVPSNHSLISLVNIDKAGDSAILLEYGEMVLDFAYRARIHALELYINSRLLDEAAIVNVAPCIRSIMVRLSYLEKACILHRRTDNV